jgi:hypothetical protein
MFDFAVGKVEFGRIDSKNLIVAKIDLKIKWFMFENIHAKVNWTKNLCVKIISRIKNNNL